MRILTGSTIALTGLLMAGCGNGNMSPVQPDRSNAVQPSGVSSSSGGTATVASKPELDPTYANGTTVYMIGPHIIQNAATTMPNAYEHAEELYLVVYPSASLPLSSGYQPQCNPCFHPGLPPPFVYHDHVITGAPGMGNNGTAGEYKAPWKIIIVQYTTAWLASPTFTPVTSATALDQAEGAGAFQVINPGGANQYEVDTGNLLICPTVSNKA
jgi:hypothetical protein